MNTPPLPANNAPSSVPAARATPLDPSPSRKPLRPPRAQEVPPACGPRSKAPQGAVKARPQARTGERSSQSAAGSGSVAHAGPGQREPPRQRERGGATAAPSPLPLRPRPTGGEGARLRQGPVRAARSRPRENVTPISGSRPLPLRPRALPLTCGRSGTRAGGVASTQACPADERHLTQRRALPPARYIRCAAYPSGRQLSQSENGVCLHSDASWSAAGTAAGGELRGSSAYQPCGLAPRDSESDRHLAEPMGGGTLAAGVGLDLMDFSLANRTTVPALPGAQGGQA